MELKQAFTVQEHLPYNPEMRKFISLESLAITLACMDYQPPYIVKFTQDNEFNVKVEIFREDKPDELIYMTSVFAKGNYIDSFSMQRGMRCPSTVPQTNPKWSFVKTLGRKAERWFTHGR